jgi:hypothetical protein
MMIATADYPPFSYVWVPAVVTAFGSFVGVVVGARIASSTAHRVSEGQLNRQEARDRSAKQLELLREIHALAAEMMVLTASYTRPLPSNRGIRPPYTWGWVESDDARRLWVRIAALARLIDDEEARTTAAVFATYVSAIGSEQDHAGKTEDRLRLDATARLDTQYLDLMDRIGQLIRSAGASG